MANVLIKATAVLSLSLLVGISAFAAPPSQHIAVCAACHGVGGNSIQAENPKLAGLHSDYILRQLKDFKKGNRKSPIMQGIISTIDDKDMEVLADYFSEQERVVDKDVNVNDALFKKGESIYANGVPGHPKSACAICHGKDGLGDKEYPRLVGQQQTYAKNQIKAFLQGERKNDHYAKMAEISRMLSDADIEAVTHYTSLVKVAGEGEKIKRGAKIFEDGVGGNAATKCTTCHGQDGSGDAKYPRIAGQHATYVETQLKTFKSGERNNDAQNAMSAVAKKLSEDDMKNLAMYLAQLKE